MFSHAVAPLAMQHHCFNQSTNLQHFYHVIQVTVRFSIHVIPLSSSFCYFFYWFKTPCGIFYTASQVFDWCTYASFLLLMCVACKTMSVINIWENKMFVQPSFFSETKKSNVNISRKVTVFKYTVQFIVQTM